MLASIPLVMTVLAPIGIAFGWWASGHILAVIIFVWGFTIAGAMAQERRRQTVAGFVFIAMSVLAWMVLDAA